MKLKEEEEEKRILGRKGGGGEKEKREKMILRRGKKKRRREREKEEDIEEGGGGEKRRKRRKEDTREKEEEEEKRMKKGKRRRRRKKKRGMRKPSLAEFKSAPMSRTKDTYNLTWQIESYPPLLKVRLLYRKVRANDTYSGKRKATDFQYRRHNNMQQHGGSAWHDQELLPPKSETFTHMMSYSISNLEPSSTYAAVVQAMNKYGWGAATEDFYFYTRSQDFENEIQPAEDMASTLTAGVAPSSPSLLLTTVLGSILTLYYFLSTYEPRTIPLIDRIMLTADLMKEDMLIQLTEVLYTLFDDNSPVLTAANDLDYTDVNSDDYWTDIENILRNQASADESSDPSSDESSDLSDDESSDLSGDESSDIFD
ncbi:hypothetical protein WDU94_008572 [Cyamophila willieti]